MQPSGLSSKVLQCEFCRKTFPLRTVGFPEHVYDVLQTYKVDQLFWLCYDCKAKKEKYMIQLLSITENQVALNETVKRLANAVEAITSPSVRNVAVRCDSAFSSMGSPSAMICDNNFSHYDGNRGSSRQSSFMSFSSSGNTLSQDSLSSWNSQSSVLPSPPELHSLESKTASVLKNILSDEIKIKDSEMKRSKEIAIEFLKDLVDCMKGNDELFKFLFNKPYYTGSAFENLRIAHADEFDVNCVLKLPFKADMWQIECIDGTSWAWCKMMKNKTLASIGNDAERKKHYEQLEKFKLMDENGFLLPSGVKNWLQSIIDRTVPKLQLKGSVTKVSISSHGPAKTLKLSIIPGIGTNFIDIDFVPAFESTAPLPYGADTSRMEKLVENRKFWFLVPKEYSGSLVIAATETKKLWRIHVPEVEKDVMHHMQCANSVIKLFKLLRDKENWKFLASYFIKTVVMWEITENPSKELWEESNLVDRYKAVFRRLESSVRRGEIRNILFPGVNLLDGQKKKHMENVANRMDIMLKKIEKDFSGVKTFYAKL